MNNSEVKKYVNSKLQLIIDNNETGENLVYVSLVNRVKNDPYMRQKVVNTISKTLVDGVRLANTTEMSQMLDVFVMLIVPICFDLSNGYVTLIRGNND